MALVSLTNDSRMTGNGRTTQTRFLRYEHKIILTSVEVEAVRVWASKNLERDAFAQDGDASYSIRTLYLDSPNLDIYHRTSDRGSTKYRIRRYGDEDVVWLERKRRRGNVVRKRREGLDLDCLDRVLNGRADFNGWPGSFREEADAGGLRPTLLVLYERSAWNGPSSARLTIDREVRVQVALDVEDVFAPPVEPTPVTDAVVLELKFDETMPPCFETVMQLIQKESGSFSKYGRGIEAVGLAPVDVPSDAEAE
ncbi:MAG: hypothetical protein CMJ83_03680 [Planctomycetes bacterium]|nr:hypothetical protein [Planctomycetota bacterium]